MGGDWRRGALAVALALLIAVSATACSDRRSASPDPTLPRRTTTTDPFAVPDPIDVAYVERVMDALDHLYGEAAREVAKEKELTPRFEELMRAIYADDETLDLTLDLWRSEERRGFSNIASDPGNPTTDVQELLTAGQCVVARVERSLDPLLVQPLGPAPQQEFVVLQRTGDPPALNPTGWRVAFEGFRQDGSVPTDECSAD